MLARITALCMGILSLLLVAPLPSTRAAESAHQFRVSLPLVLVGQPVAAHVAEQTLEAQTVAQINQERVANGCPPLQMHSALSVAAAAHSRDMAVQNYFSHTGQNGSTFSQRTQAAAYPFHASGEIIAAGQATAAATVAQWINSSGHRAIILTCANDDIGIGMYADPTSQWHYYWTAVFGQR